MLAPPVPHTITLTTDATSPAELSAAWRALAAALRHYASADAAACAYECAADALDTLCSRNDNELLTLAEAADASGYSVDHLGRLVRQGAIQSAGRPNAPRIRRGDLPIHTSRALAREVSGAYSPETDARALLSRRGGR